MSEFERQSRGLNGEWDESGKIRDNLKIGLMRRETAAKAVNRISPL